MSNGTSQATTIRGYPDQRGAAILKLNRKAHSLQAIGRIRAVRPGKPKRILILSSLALPSLPVDSLVLWQELVTGLSRIELSAKSQRLASALYPDGGRWPVTGLRLSASGIREDAPDASLHHILQPSGGAASPSTRFMTLYAPLRGAAAAGPLSSNSGGRAAASAFPQCCSIRPIRRRLSRGSDPVSSWFQLLILIKETGGQKCAGMIDDDEIPIFAGQEEAIEAWLPKRNQYLNCKGPRGARGDLAAKEKEAGGATAAAAPRPRPCCCRLARRGVRPRPRAAPEGARG